MNSLESNSESLKEIQDLAKRVNKVDPNRREVKSDIMAKVQLQTFDETLPFE